MKVSSCDLSASREREREIEPDMCLIEWRFQDPGLVSLVPPLKKALEVFIYKVKHVLESNKAVLAFVIGNLKHKNVMGEVGILHSPGTYQFETAACSRE
jgi:hypothetical protein